MHSQKKIYTPNYILKRGIYIWKDMFAELISSHELIWRLFIRDISAKYRQSILGYVWVLIIPFISIGAFVILNKSGIIHIAETDIPYPLFALIGISIWQIFSKGIAAGCNSLVAAGSMIGKINFPREVLVFASFGQALFEFMIKCILIVILCFVFQYKPHLEILFFPLFLIPIIILTIGLSLIFSLINGIFRDFGNSITYVLTFLMFLTPVLYPLKDSKNIFLILNPLSPLITAPRDLIIYGTINQPLEFFIASVLSVLVFFICWRIFHIAESMIAERI